MRRSCWLTCLLSLVANLADAQTTRFNEYFEKLVRHPSVNQLAEQSVRLQALSDSKMGLPNPELFLGLDNVPLDNLSFNDYLPTAKVIGIQQRIPNRKKRKAQSAMKNSQSLQQALMADYRYKRLRAMFVLQLVELEKNRRLQDLVKEKISLYRLIEKDLKGQLESGISVYARFAEMDASLTDLEQRLNDLKATQVGIQEAFIQLVGEVPELAVPPISVHDWVKEGSSLYPLLIAELELHWAQEKVAVAELDLEPSYGIQARYKQRESSKAFDGDDWLSIQASISLPIWSQANQIPKLRAAKAEHRSAEFRYEDIQRQWYQRMASLAAKKTYTYKNVLLLVEKRAAFQRMIAAAERKYESGNSALESVLRVQLDQISISEKLVIQRSLYQSLNIDFNSHTHNIAILKEVSDENQ